MRTAGLNGLFFLSMTFLSALLCGCGSLKDSPIEGKSAVYVKSAGGVSLGEWMPETSKDIEYTVHDTGFGHSAQWKCRVSETDFLIFCKEKGYSPLPKRLENDNFLFRYYGSFDMPEKYYYVLKPTASSAALRLLYDRDTHRLYGSYADR